MQPQKWFGIVSLFPDMFTPFIEQGVFGRAVKKGLIETALFNPRDYTHDKHRTVDDRPYGGGPGMLMMVQPLDDALTAAKKAGGENTQVVYLSPQGRRLDYNGATELARHNKIVFLCGRYEGIDERIIDKHVDQQWSIGDYVLSGGELPAMVTMDAIARLVPGVLGHDQSATQDSFTDGLLDCPHYTRPENWEGQSVPSVLLSGDHEKIRQWRLQQSLKQTLLRRPEMFNDLALTEEQAALLQQVKRDLQQDDS
ncbi:tRNA (guanosine(37)-N1)-methyltransferase TrmD [Alteromonas sediminis]|uniref:tRNA (guanine-N(1)-)-methyltransferase n=1 Tax=Alteromonas sediminis TaxID=2259342 RepID=A0A3N5Y5F8_9ALTE|nr:tRNA (guanosine(37)-N1)-methyltransferase TrmD [Alteromonas sediminis]RPJ68503.1 tRNA (guanosine(37)-N1)-methyltransferase TrmD [Alteromonas sediminis]